MKVIIGPCVIENGVHGDRWLLEVAMEVASAVTRIRRANRDNAIDFDLDIYFKSSFDKANRTSINSFRGPGLYDGLEALAHVKDTLGLKVLTDIHEPSQAEHVAAVCDVIQVPAFLCRQTDLLVAAGEAAGKYDRVVNIKKGQQMPASAMMHAANKVIEAGCDRQNVWLTERGSFFGYGDITVDMRNLVEMRNYGKVIFDATHSVQKPGGADGTTGGDRSLVPTLLRGACAVGVDGVFLEMHPDPENAKSDAGSQYPLSEIDKILETLVSLRRYSP